MQKEDEMNGLPDGQILSCIEEVKRGNSPQGLQILKYALDHPKAKAWYGYCLAREKKEYGIGIALCNEALNTDPRDGEIYLALGRIFLLLNRREKAISVLEQGMKMNNFQGIARLLKVLGVRQRPVFPFLNRRNPLNVTSGLLFSKMGVR